MADKVQKIREEVERLKGWNNNVRNSTRHMTLQEEDFNRGKHSSYIEILDFIDSLQEEAASEELEEAAELYALDDSIKPWRELVKGAFKAGAKWQKNHLWKPADGDNLPEYEREVVAFQEIFPTDVDVPSLLKIVITHRPNPEGYDGKSIATGVVEHYTPKTYGEGGWNIPNIAYWLDVELPKELNYEQTKKL